MTVYSTPDCVQCRLTYVALEKAGIGYRVVDLEQDAAAREHVTTVLGHSTAPVVVVDGDPAVHWSGFRRDRIAALAGAGPTGGLAADPTPAGPVDPVHAVDPWRAPDA